MAPEFENIVIQSDQNGEYFGTCRFEGTFAPFSITQENITEKVSSARDGWYDLQGRRLNGTPQRKGIYIHNGKKTVIK